MPLINPTLPEVGEFNTTADPKILDAVNELLGLVNGDLDAANLADAAVTARKLAIQPSCVVRRTLGQSVPHGTNTAIVFDTANATEERDTDNMHSLVTNPSRFTAQTAGLYVCTANFAWGTLAGPSPAREAIFLLKNGATRYGTTEHYRPNSSISNPAGSGQALAANIPMGQGDYLELYGYFVNEAGAGIGICAEAVVTMCRVSA